MTKQKRSETIVREWNERNPVGTKVVVYAVGAGPIEPHVGETTSSAWVLCREPVISVSGLAGSISLDRVRVQTQEPKSIGVLMHNDIDGQLKLANGGSVIGRYTSIVDESGQMIAESVTHRNAARIVACVNACAGLDPSKLMNLLLECLALETCRSVDLEEHVACVSRAFRELVGNEFGSEGGA